MKTIIKVIILCCHAGLLFSCYEDKGNHDLADYNKITLATVGTPATTAIYGDTLRVVPAITWRYPDRDTTAAAFEYRWEISDEVVSTERNLVHVPTRMGALPCVLFVTEKATGVVTRWATTFTVNSPYNIGWVILSEKENRSVLSFIRRDERRDENNAIVYSWADFTDIYHSMYPDDPLPGSINQVISYPVDYYADELLLASDSGEDWILDGLFLQKISRLQGDFLGGRYPAGFTPKYFARGGGVDCLLGTDGKVYWRKNQAANPMLHTSPFLTVPSYFPGDARIEYFVHMNTYEAEFLFMYDALNNRLIACYVSYGINDELGKMFDIVYSSPSPDFTDITNLGPYKLLYCGEHAGGFNNILKDPASGKYLLQEFRAATSGGGWFSSPSSVAIDHATQREFEAGHLISDNTVFWRMRTSSFLYFGEGSKLYFYDFNTRETRLYTDFGTGHITRLMQDVDGTRVGVVLDNGEFHLFDAISPAVLASDNPGVTGFLHRLSGLGNIKSITWKHGGDYKWRDGTY